VAKAICSLNQIRNVSRRMSCQWVISKAGSRSYVGVHATGEFELVIRCRGKQSDHQILQSDDAHVERPELGLSHFRHSNTVLPR